MAADTFSNNGGQEADKDRGGSGEEEVTSLRAM